MTCAECKVVRERGFWEATIAERKAVATHYRKCKACRVEIDRLGDAALAKKTPEQRQQMKLLSAARFILDEQDPEV
jgi:hypothetical protein